MPTPLSPERIALRSKLANAERYGVPEEKRAAIRRDYRAAQAEQYIRELVDSAPPLTDDQRRKLAALLVPGGAE